MSRSPSHQTLRRLVYFAAIAEAGSIRGAAARLGLSVPVVSEALSELEAELSVTLAERTTRRFTLTETGRAVRAAADEMLRLAEGVRSIGAPDAPLTGRLAVTLPVELASDWLAQRLHPFRARNPRLELVVEATDAVVDLGRRMVDVAVRTTYRPPGAPPTAHETLPLLCVAARRPTLEPVPPDGLRLDMPLIARRPDAWFEAREAATGRPVALRAAETIVIDNGAAAIAMAREGLGAALVVARSVADDLAAGRLVPVAPALGYGAIAVDYRFRDTLPSPAARAFVAFLRGFAGAPG